MKIGKFNVDIVDTGLFGLDGGSMFGVVPKALWAKSYHPGDDLNRIPLAARPLLIRWDNNNLLIDTGNGTKMNEKLVKIYNVDIEKSNLNTALKPLGVKEEEINHVILTHLHFDHAGGATKFENGKLVPTFPNAKFYIQKEHIDWALNPTEKDRGSFMKDDFIPLIENGMFEKLEGAGEVFPGIEVIPVYGHTKAMQIVKISDGSTTLLYAADVVPTSAHINPNYILGFDNNPLTTVEEKKKIIPQVYEESWLICYEHDAFVQASKVTSTDKGFTAFDKIKITN